MFNKFLLESCQQEGTGQIPASVTAGWQHWYSSLLESPAPLSPVGATPQGCISLHHGKLVYLILGKKSPLPVVAAPWNTRRDLQMLGAG